MRNFSYFFFTCPLHQKGNLHLVNGLGPLPSDKQMVSACLVLPQPETKPLSKSEKMPANGRQIGATVSPSNSISLFVFSNAKSWE